MRLAEIIRTGLSRVDTIAVKRTALNPLLWMVGLVTPLALILTSIVADPVVRMGLLAFAAVPILFTMVVYLIWMFRDPDRLQSEEYRVRQQALHYLHKKGGSDEIVDLANQVARIEKANFGPDDGEIP